jgi:uncharacterized delta-60 repeat protein
MSRARRLKSSARLRLEALEQRALFSAGDLDLSFGAGGRVTTDFFASGDHGQAVALQADGNIVAVGRTGAGGSGLLSNFALARYHPNGSLDLSFSNDGLVATDFAQGDDDATDVAIQADGKIVVVGSAHNESNGLDFALARYDPDGTLDLTFGTNGKVMTDFSASHDSAQGVAIQADGKIVVLGTVDVAFGLARYNSDGSLDPTFGGDGLVTTSFLRTATSTNGNGVALQVDGRIVAVGSVDKFMTVARYLPNGDLDTTLGGTGAVLTDFSFMHVGVFQGAEASSVAIQDDGRIVVAGHAAWPTQSFFALARYLPDGSSDADFDADGKLLTSFAPGTYSDASKVAIQSDRKIVASGLSTGGHYDFGVARYKPDGSLDKSFSSDGTVRVAASIDPKANSVPYGMVIQPDGKIVIAGSVSYGGGPADFALVRLQGSVGLNVQVFNLNQTLFINGDSTNNDIGLIDNGPDGISVYENRRLLGVFTDIQKVVANLGAGDDTLVISVPRDAREVSLGLLKRYQFDMGLGNDHLNVDMDAQSNVGSLSFTLGGGDDTLDVSLGNLDPPTGTPGPDDRQLPLNISAGAGNDQVNITCFDIFANTWAGRVDLGLGDDRFQATFDIDDLVTNGKQIDPGNFTVGLDVLGQQGNDTMGLLVGEATAGAGPHILNSHVRVNLDGGAGDDNFVTDIANVTVNGPLEIEANGGAGNDTLMFHFDKLTFNGSTSINLLGGGGDDDAMIVYGNVALNAPVSLTDDYGTGNDVAQWDWENVAVNAAVTQKVNFGSGDDNAMIIYGNVALSAATSTSIDGGLGSDVVQWDWENVAVNAAVAQKVNLGSGDDFAALNAYNVAFNADTAFDVDGFDGSDTVGFVVIGGMVAQDASVAIDVHGGGGADELRLASNGVTIDTGGEFDACLEGNGGNDLLDTSSSAYGTGVYNVEISGGEGADKLNQVLKGKEKWGPGASVKLAMFGDGGGDALSIGGVMPELDQGAKWEMTATGDDGNDTIAASLQFVDAIGGAASFDFAGGKGNDRILADMQPSVLPGGELHVAMDGNDGDDILLATLRNTHMDGLFDLDLCGDAGADNLFLGGFMPSARPEAQSMIHVSGDAGNDKLVANLAFEADFLGSLDFMMEGGLGDDRLTAILPIESRSGISVLIDGGLGRDIALVGRNLLPFVVNCEQVTPL